MPGPDRKRRLTAFVVAMAVLIVTPLAVVASDRFNDVPDSNIFHDDIAWLADNDVTRGCNPPDNDEFCPSDNVTRQQMAAFMRRLAENEVVNAATANEADHAATSDSATTADNAASAGDADTLDGFDASQVMPRAAFNASNNLPNENTSLETTISAPAPGVLVVAGVVEAFGGPDVFDCFLAINGEQVVGTYMIVELDGAANSEEDCTTSGAANVQAGTYTVAIQIVGVDVASFEEASVTATWIPLDGTGSVPTEVTSLADPTAKNLSDRENR